MSISATALSRRSTSASVPITSTSKPRHAALADLLRACASRRASRRRRRRPARPAGGRRRCGRAWPSRARGTRPRPRTGSPACRRRTAERAPAARSTSPPSPAIDDDLVDRAGELALVDPPRAAVEVGVAELAVLEQREQLAARRSRGPSPRARRAAARARRRARGRRPTPPRADVALAHHALDDPQDGRRVRARGAVAAARATGSRAPSRRGSTSRRCPARRGRRRRRPGRARGTPRAWRRAASR